MAAASFESLHREAGGDCRASRLCSSRARGWKARPAAGSPRSAKLVILLAFFIPIFQYFQKATVCQALFQVLDSRRTIPRPGGARLRGVGWGRYTQAD